MNKIHVRYKRSDRWSFMIRNEKIRRKKNKKKGRYNKVMCTCIY